MARSTFADYRRLLKRRLPIRAFVRWKVANRRAMDENSRLIAENQKRLAQGLPDWDVLPPSLRTPAAPRASSSPLWRSRVIPFRRARDE